MLDSHPQLLLLFWQVRGSPSFLLGSVTVAEVLASTPVTWTGCTEIWCRHHGRRELVNGKYEWMVGTVWVNETETIWCYRRHWMERKP